MLEGYREGDCLGSIDAKQKSEKRRKRIGSGEKGKVKLDLAGFRCPQVIKKEHTKERGV